MITEDYVSFEIAKLLKEKGFNEGCRSRYGSAGSFSYEKYEIEASGCEMHNAILAPTLQMAMKWLREVHHIALNIGWGEILEDKFQWWCIILNQKDGSIFRESEYSATYEEAVELAIKYCLEHLI